MKNFVGSLYDCESSGVNDKRSGYEEEAAIVTETDQSISQSHGGGSSKTGQLH